MHTTLSLVNMWLDGVLQAWGHIIDVIMCHLIGFRCQGAKMIINHEITSALFYCVEESVFDHIGSISRGNRHREDTERKHQCVTI